MKDISCDLKNLNFSIGTSYPPYKEQELHVHDACELYYLIQGHGYYETEGTRYEFTPGMILLMQPGESHRAVRFDTSPYQRMSIHFHPSVVDSIDPERIILRTFYNRAMGTRNYYDQEMLSETNAYQYLDKMTVQCSNSYLQGVQVLSFLLPLLTELGKIFDKERVSTVDKNTLIIHDILDYINRNLSTPLSIDLICDKFFITRTQLYRVFKKHTKMNAWEYIVLKRLVLARSLITDGVPVSDAAKACGFKDYSTFYRAYSAKYGDPPSGVHRIKRKK